jgi:hypothetical protein
MILLARISLDHFSQMGSFLAVPVMIGVTLQFMDEVRRGVLKVNYEAQESNVSALREVENSSDFKSFVEVKLMKNQPTFAVKLQTLNMILLLLKHPVKKMLLPLVLEFRMKIECLSLK